MDCIRNWAVFLLAAASLAFGGAASAAPVKQWSVGAAPSSFTTSTNVKVTLTVTNQTPNGNSNINSLQITLPAGYTFDTGDHSVPVSTSWNGQLNWTPGGVITLSNMSPLKPQGSFTLVAYLNINTGTVGCTATAWPGAPQTMAWTGSSFSGDTFLLTSTPSTGVNANSSLAFGSLPTGTISAGTSITGTVQATSCGAPASGVTVTATMGSQSSGGTTGTNGQTGFTFSTSGLAAGTYTINATGPTGYPPISTTVTVCINGLAFTVQPSNVQAGNPDSATVKATSCSNPGTVVGGVPVTAQVYDSTGSKVGAPLTVSTDATSTDAGYGSAVFNFTAPANVGTYTIGATATNYSDATSASFKVFNGVLNCNPNPPFKFSDPNVNVTDPSVPGYAAGERGYWNKDGLACVPLLYTFTNSILTPDPLTGEDNTVHLAWDTSTSQLPAFTYTMTWKTVDAANPLNPPSNTDTTTYGWPVLKRTTYVAWQTSGDGTVSGGSGPLPVYVPALTCASKDLPAPYGSLDAAIDNAQTSIVVDVPPTVPAGYPSATMPVTASPAAPFPIVIGTERMSVTGVSVAGGQYTLTVVRGDGMTTKAAHTGGVYVMSTPLPIDTDSTSPYYLQQVHMCVVNQGWMAVGIDPVTGIPQVDYFTTVYDIGDGFVKGSF